ncbi:zinc finger, C2H2-like, DNA-binding domain protein [Tanacetum coccineum]
MLKTFSFHITTPSKVHFNSCKDVALSLKSQLETKGTNPPDEGAMMLVEGDSPVEFDFLHTNPLQNVAVEDEVTYGNPCRDTILVVDNHQKVQNKKRKRKPKALKNDKSDFQGLGVISINGKKIDLLYLARDASDEFEAKLNKMTEGMIKEAEFMGVLKDLEGKWSSTKKRRKFVKATIFGDAFPENWRILLGLRPRVYPFSLYCCKFERPSGIQFDSCKEAAFYIKSLYDANPLEQGDIMLTENDSHVDNQHKVPMRKRTRKSKAVENSDEDYKGLGVTKVIGEMMDLNHLARAGDSVFEDKLKKITEGMESEGELLGPSCSPAISSLPEIRQDEMSSNNKSDCNTEISIGVTTFNLVFEVFHASITVRNGPSYPDGRPCSKKICPTGRQFDSCKDVAFFLKTQSEEEATMLREKGCQVGPESVARVPRSSTRASDLNSLGTNDASHVPIQCLIQCNYCTDSFKSISVLESHLQRAHKPIIQSLYTETLSRKHSVPCGAVIVQEMNSIKQKSAAV